MDNKPQHVAIWRRLVADKLRLQLPSGATVVDSPDHPFLLHGPDILVAFEGKILAAFLESYAEAVGDERRLALRVKLSRAVLPLHSNFVYLGERELSPKLSSVFNDVYQRLGLYDSAGHNIGSGDEIVIPQDMVRLAHKEPAEARSIELEARAEIFRRFDAVYWGSEINRLVRSKKQKKEQGGREVHMGLVVEARSNHPNSIRSLMFSNESPSHQWISIDEGFAAPGSDAFGLLIAGRLPEVNGDPDKYLRSLAFAGWLTADEWEDSFRVGRVSRLIRGRSNVQG